MRNITYSPSYRGLPILTDESHGCSTDMLERMYALFGHVIAKHNKVFFMRFDVRFPNDRQYPSDNEIFERFIAYYIKSLKRQGVDPYYAWAREHDTSINHHYHCVLLLDGNLTQSTHGHLQLADKLWNNALGITVPNDNWSGLIEKCNQHHNGIMMRRGDPDFNRQRDTCFEWASYLLKENTKECVPGVRSFGWSQLS